VAKKKEWNVRALRTYLVEHLPKRQAAIAAADKHYNGDAGSPFLTDMIVNYWLANDLTVHQASAGVSATRRSSDSAMLLLCPLHRL
jgi:hypothetical protein